MLPKLIQEIKFVGKAMYETVRGIKFVQKRLKSVWVHTLQFRRIEFNTQIWKYINVISIRRFLESGIIVGCPHQVPPSHVIQVGWIKSVV